MSLLYEPYIFIDEDPLYSDPDGIKFFQWWDDFKSLHWTTRVLGWIIQIIIMICFVVLLFCIPRALVSPVFNFFSMTRFLPNFMVMVINTIVFFIVSYFFFLYATLFIDSWVLPLVGTIVMFIFWIRLHLEDIRYYRCPRCHTMYSGLSAGTTFKGRSKNITVGTYDKYLKTTTHYEDSGHTRVDTKHYETRPTITTSVTDNYLNHRTCSRCFYQWDVASQKVSKKKKYL
jgi:hypothetical protein